ncbi:MAG: ABC transporter substrate-binding protein [Alphaproteobacteria bacterium]
MKIVSLIPSATEIIFALNLCDNLVGISHECDYPKEILKLPKLTTSRIKIEQSSLKIDYDIKKILEKSLSVYEVKSDLLRKLDPDVIITQSQCSVCAVSLKDVEECLSKFIDKKPLLIDLKPNTFDEVLKDINRVGEILNKKVESHILVNNIKNEINKIKAKTLHSKISNVLCIEWIEPIMTAGNWVPQLVEFAGGKSVLAKSGKNSNFIKSEHINFKEIDIVIFMPCGFDIKRSKKEISKANVDYFSDLKDKKTFIVDGNKYFNRPGPDLLESTRILAEIIHPDIFPAKQNIKRWVSL